jgi:hypothetical protein
MKPGKPFKRLLDMWDRTSQQVAQLHVSLIMMIKLTQDWAKWWDSVDSVIDFRSVWSQWAFRLKSRYTILKTTLYREVNFIQHCWPVCYRNPPPRTCFPSDQQ